MKNIILKNAGIGGLIVAVFSGISVYFHSKNLEDTTLSYMANFLSYQICGGVLECDYRELTVGVNELTSLNESVQVFPNPAKNYFLVQGNGIEKINVYLEKYKDWLEIHSFILSPVNKILFKRYGVISSAIYVIRPDGYVGFRINSNNHLLLKKYLKNFFE